MPGLLGPSAAGSLAGLLDDELTAEPAVNLSNKLNPNNIHYDRELAARCGRAAERCLVCSMELPGQRLQTAGQTSMQLRAVHAAGRRHACRPCRVLR